MRMNNLKVSFSTRKAKENDLNVNLNGLSTSYLVVYRTICGS